MSKEDRILVVDDEAVIRDLMAGILGDEGFTVELAPNGLAALERLREQDDFVVLFTDIMMPGMDGIELIREAQKLCPSLVTIVMTGYATMETARAAVQAGAYDYVLKPFNLSEIKMALKNALERFQLLSENARLLEITELFKISERIAATRDEDDLFDYVLNAVLDRVSAKRGSVMLLSADAQKLEIARSVGASGVEQGMVVDVGRSISGWVAQHVKPLLIKDIQDHPDVEGLSLRLGDRSFVSVPLERASSPLEAKGTIEPEQRVIAVLNVTEKKNGGSFSESDLKSVSIIANQAAVALENVRLIRDIEDGQREIVFTLGEIVETRSRETGNHVKRVSEYSKVLGRNYGLSNQEVEILRLAAPLHDVGKVGIPDAILNKPSKLKPEEYEIIKTHAMMGYDMLKVAKGRVLQAAALIAHEHHEKYNGTGYPQGLKGKDIHVFGRIAGIADVFDALGVQRAYKKAWKLDRILDHFREQRGEHFDPELLDVFFEHLDEILAIRDDFPEVQGNEG